MESCKYEQKTDNSRKPEWPALGTQTDNWRVGCPDRSISFLPHASSTFTYMFCFLRPFPADPQEEDGCISLFISFSPFFSRWRSQKGQLHFNVFLLFSVQTALISECVKENRPFWHKKDGYILMLSYDSPFKRLWSVSVSKRTVPFDTQEAHALDVPWDNTMNDVGKREFIQDFS